MAGIMKDFRGISLLRNDACIHHFWMRGYRDLIKKHAMYLKYEGEALHEKGLHFSLKRTFGKPLIELKRNLVDFRGLYGGWTGLFLSFFWASYVFFREVALFRYERSKKQVTHETA